MNPQRDEGELLRAFLTERDVCCPVCRYNLRGVGSRQCPECGARLDLRVASIDYKLGPWLLCVFALALPMGFSGVLAVIALIGAKISAYWSTDDWVVLGGSIGLTAAYAIGLWALVKRRPAFLRKSATKQWLWAWTLVAAMILLQIAVVLIMNGYLQ